LALFTQAKLHARKPEVVCKEEGGEKMREGGWREYPSLHPNYITFNWGFVLFTQKRKEEKKASRDLFIQAEQFYTESCEKFSEAHTLKPEDNYVLYHWATVLQHQASVSPSSPSLLPSSLPPPPSSLRSK
jgi:hypothetical protein